MPALFRCTWSVYWLASWQEEPTPIVRATAVPIGRALPSSWKWASALSQFEPSALSSFSSIPSPYATRDPDGGTAKAEA